MKLNIHYRLGAQGLQASVGPIQLQVVYDIYPLVLAVLKVNLHSDRKLSPASSSQVKGGLSNFHEVVWFVARMKEEPNFLDKVVNAGLPARASDIHHPLMG